MAKRPNEQETIIADFSEAGIPSVEGSFMVKIESDDFRVLQVRRFTADDAPAVAGIAVGLVRLL